MRDFFHFIAKLHEPPLCLGVARPRQSVSGLAKASAPWVANHTGTLVRIW